MGMGIDAHEVDALIFDLGSAPERIAKRASQAIAKTAHDIEADAKAIAPVDTGFLKNSITSDIGELSAEIGPTAHYGAYVEEGTSRQNPQPYMRPAFDRRKEGLVKAMEQLLEDGTL